jgi:hypothetical protein
MWIYFYFGQVMNWYSTVGLFQRSKRDICLSVKSSAHSKPDRNLDPSEMNWLRNTFSDLHISAHKKTPKFYTLPVLL